MCKATLLASGSPALFSNSIPLLDGEAWFRFGLLDLLHFCHGFRAAGSPLPPFGPATPWEKQQVHANCRHKRTSYSICPAKSQAARSLDTRLWVSWMMTGAESRSLNQLVISGAVLFPGLADFLRHSVVDEAAIYLPLRSYYENAAELVLLCEQHGIALRFDKQIFSLRIPQSHTQDLEENSQALVAGSAGAWASSCQAGLGLCFVRTSRHSLCSPVFSCGRTCQVHFGGTRIFSSDPRRFEQTAIQDLQIPNYDRQCRTNPG